MLVAVSKTKSIEDIKELYNLGHPGFCRKLCTGIRRKA
jgi:uncharacterized pyridoxal phosphate-containing UPF0001 family protein